MRGRFAEDPMSFETEKMLLLVGLALFTVVFVGFWGARIARGRRSEGVRPPTLFECAIGLVTDFFDTRSASAASRRRRRSSSCGGWCRTRTSPAR
jgi:hypothetical protein